MPITLTFDSARQRQDELWNKSQQTGKALDDFVSRFEKGPFNLTPDFVKALPEYVKLKGEHDVAFAELRNYNAWYTKTFKKEIREFRTAQRAAQLKGE